MAETAAILSPSKIVLLPDPGAGCPLADMIDLKSLLKFQEEHPGAKTVCYINTSAEIKAHSDICCTSANAESIVKKYPANEIIFVPDKSLGAFVASRVENKKIHLYPGFCPTHHRLILEDLLDIKQIHPDAKIMVHPECTEDILKEANFILGTGGMLRVAREDPAREFIIGTEEGMLHRLRKENPEKKFYLASEKMICPNMKLITLEKVCWSLENMEHQISVSDEIRESAFRCIDAMLNIN